MGLGWQIRNLVIPEARRVVAALQTVATTCAATTQIMCSLQA